MKLGTSMSLQRLLISKVTLLGDARLGGKKRYASLVEKPDGGFRTMDAFLGGWLWIAAV